MDELLKYTRLVFEIQYFNKVSNVECVADLVKMGFARCICIPGIAANYILNVLKNSFKEFKGSGEIVWDSYYHRYIVQCKGEADETWFPNFCSESEGALLKNDVCEERPSIVEEEEADFAYIKIRNKSEIKRVYGITADIYRIEKCLVLLHERDCNSKELVSLFSFIANEYRGKWNMKEYLDKLFRLYFFLFPEECLELVKVCSREAEDKEFFEYNINVLDDYGVMASNSNSNGSKLDIKAVSDFLGIDFGKVYTYYMESVDCGDIKGLNEVINRRLNGAKEQRGNVRDVIENYCKYYMISV